MCSSDLACDMEYADSCYNLGVLYNSGQGVSQDKKAAEKYFGKACDMEYADGCYNLGVLYGKGQGVKQDHKKASELYSKACEISSFS